MKQVNIKLSCGTCAVNFSVNTKHYQEMGFSNLPKTCPNCTNHKQGNRGEALKERAELHFFPKVKLGYFPVKMELKKAANDGKDFYHGHWDGEDVLGWGQNGGNKGGSLTFYASKLIQQGEIVSFRHMSVTNVGINDEDIYERTYEYVYLADACVPCHPHARPA